MTSAKGVLLRWAGRLALRDAVVTAAEDAGRDFRLLRLDVGDARWEPGDKVQVLLPGDDVRTLTPTHWTRGGTELLVYLHPGMAAAWGRAVRPGDVVRFVGPQRSLRLPEGPVTIVGDETSIAVAAAYSGARPGQVAVVLEAGVDVELAWALASVGLADPVVVRRLPGDAHHPALVSSVLAARRGTVAITGGGGLVQGVRRGLREAGVSDVKVKAYWVEGKVALD